MTATIGALTFRLAGNRTVRGLSFDGQPLMLHEGDLVQRVARRTHPALVIDHREQRPSAPTATRVELWRATGDCEGAVRSLFVLADSVEPRARR